MTEQITRERVDAALSEVCTCVNDTAPTVAIIRTYIQQQADALVDMTKVYNGQLDKISALTERVRELRHAVLLSQSALLGVHDVLNNSSTLKDVMDTNTAALARKEG